MYLTDTQKVVIDKGRFKNLILGLVYLLDSLFCQIKTRQKI